MGLKKEGINFKLLNLIFVFCLLMPKPSTLFANDNNIASIIAFLLDAELCSNLLTIPNFSLAAGGAFNEFSDYVLQSKNSCLKIMKLAAPVSSGPQPPQGIIRVHKESVPASEGVNAYILLGTSTSSGGTSRRLTFNENFPGGSSPSPGLDDVTLTLVSPADVALDLRLTIGNSLNTVFINDISVHLP